MNVGRAVTDARHATHRDDEQRTKVEQNREGNHSEKRAWKIGVWKELASTSIQMYARDATPACAATARQRHLRVDEWSTGDDAPNCLGSLGDLNTQTADGHDEQQPGRAAALCTRGARF